MSLFHIDAGKEWRGGQRQSLFLVQELKRKGFPVFFVVQPRSPLHKKASEINLPVIPLKIRNEFDMLSIFRLFFAMRRRKCRLAHFHDAHSVAVGSVAASMAKVPLRVISRRVDFPLKKNYFSRKKYLSQIDAVIAISEGIKKVLVESGLPPGRIEVIPYGIDFTPYKEALSSDHLRREFARRLSN